MNTHLIPPEIGQWYAHTDEIDAATWGSLPLERIEPPEDATAPLDDIETDDLGYSETDMTEADWREPLQPLSVQEESWEDTAADNERDMLGEGSPEEPFIFSPDAIARPR